MIKIIIHSSSVVRSYWICKLFKTVGNYGMTITKAELAVPSSYYLVLGLDLLKTDDSHIILGPTEIPGICYTRGHLESTQPVLYEKFP